MRHHGVKSKWSLTQINLVHHRHRRLCQALLRVPVETYEQAPSHCNVVS